MKKLLITASILVFGFCSSAQKLEHGHEFCSKHKSSLTASFKTTVADPSEDDYDVNYVKLDVNLNPSNTIISGNVLTNAKVVVSSMSKYVFELSTFNTIDSCKIDGQLVTATSNGVIRTINLPTTLNQNASFTAQVFYHGQAPSGTGFFSYGIRNQTSPSWGAKVTYTLSEPYGARDWWPCKQALMDKIDSADIWMTVPDTCKAGSNGVLTAITPMGNSKQRFEWTSRYPIDYYLISVAVSKYVDYSYYFQFPNSTDSMLYQNYIYANPQTLTNWKQKIDSVPDMIIYFSDLFGRYPFWKEKYGHCMAPLSGGMEHQTMSTVGYFTTTLVAHELGHQWFGDHATCGTWKDIWLNEGFASYIEYLYVNHFRNNVKAFDFMKDVHNNVMSDVGGSVYVDDTTSDSRIFDSRLSYDKGSAVVHTLRFEFNDDNLFFQTLKNYQQVYSHGTPTTAQFQQLIATALNRNMDTFFNQWIYKEGYPIYQAKWNQIGNQIYVQLNQTTSAPASQTLFVTPIEIKLKSANGDTVVRLHNKMNTQNFTIQWSKTMTGMVVDPNDWLLDSTVSVARDNAMNVSTLENENAISIVPNPTNNSWHIVNLAGEHQLNLFSINGSLIWSTKASNDTEIPADNLPSGMYFLNISNEKINSNFKLIKQ